MTTSLAYVLHSGQLFGTERMALATLCALREVCDGLIIAPPGPVHAAAREAGLQSRVVQGRLGLLWCLLAHLRQHRHSAVFTTGVSQALVARALQRLCAGRGPHVHMVHGGTEERLSYGRKRWLARLQVRQVAVSAFVRSRLLAHGVPERCIEVVHNFLPPGARAQRSAFTADGVRRVIMLTRLDRIKRVGLLFDALERTPGLQAMRFDIYGSGEEAALLQARAQGHPNVHLHGFVPDAAAALADADLLLHTCPEEPFGLVLLEAFAAGVPVLVPNSGGAGEIVQADVNGWRFTANNATALGQRLLSLAKMPAAQLNAVVAGGRASLQQTFAPERQAARYAELVGVGA